MSTQAPKSIGEAINEFTEDDVPADEPEVADEEKDNTNVDEGELEGAEEEETSEEESSEKEGEEEGSEEGEEEAEAESEEEEAEEGTEDFFDSLTPEDLAVIKGSPELQKVRKLLLRGYNKKMEGRNQDLRLIDLYKKDPIGVLNAMAGGHGFQLAQRPDQQKEQQQQQTDQIEESRKTVEKIFGAAGPMVREALEKHWELLNGQKITPLQQQLTKMTGDAETYKMQVAEAEWRQRNKGVLTPKLEKAVLDLGNSGRYVPGRNVSYGEYLDDLTTIAQSKMATQTTSEARREVSRKLAKKIENNRRAKEPTGLSSKAKVDKVSRLSSDPGSFRSLSEAIQYADDELSQEE